jgi:hypothetical protein
VPNRIVREGILTSERVNQLSPAGEVFYRRLMSVVDDYGRFDGRHVMLKVSCFPLRVDSVREADIPRWIAECEKAGLIVLYAVNAKPYVELLDFRQRTRAKESRYPPRPGAGQLPCGCLTHDGHVTDRCLTHAHGDGDGDGDGDGAARKRAVPLRKAPLPTDFEISDRVRAWAAGRGVGMLERHFEHFVGTAKAKGYTYVDWDEAFMNAIRKNWAAIDAPKKRVAAL